MHDRVEISIYCIGLQATKAAFLLLERRGILAVTSKKRLALVGLQKILPNVIQIDLFYLLVL